MVNSPARAKKKKRNQRPRGPAGGKGPVFMALREVAKLPEVMDRKGALLDRLDNVWASAMGRSYTNKSGKKVPNPDGATAIRVVEVAAELVGVAAVPAGARPIDLSVFNGGKSAATEKKAG